MCAEYGELFRYFDSLLLGLTATPKDDIDHNTCKLFAMEDGVPTDSYGLHEAAAEGYLVLPRAVKVPLKFMEHGIRYADLSEAEKAEWDAKEWTEDGDVPEAVGRHDMNKYLFSVSSISCGSWTSDSSPTRPATPVLTRSTPKPRSAGRSPTGCTRPSQA